MFFFQKHCEIQSSATQRGFSKRCSFSMVGLGLKVPFGYVNLVRESIEKGSMQVLQISGRYRIKFCFLVPNGPPQFSFGAIKNRSISLLGTFGTFVLNTPPPWGGGVSAKNKRRGTHSQEIKRRVALWLSSIKQ